MGAILATTVRLLAILLAVVLAVPCLNGVSASSASTEVHQIALESELRIGFMQGIDSMDPYVGLNDVSKIFYGLVYDCLQSVGEDMDPQPNLASSWWPLPTSDPAMVGMPFGSIWQYNLTADVTWSDGQPFTADDVVWNINLNADVVYYPSMWAYQPNTYFTHQAWRVDDHTVRISFWDRETGAPVPAAYAYLISIPMLPKHLLESYGFAFIGMNWTGVFTNTESPGLQVVGTGPFMSTPSLYNDWLAGDHITLVRNPKYHSTAVNGDYLKFDKLTMKFFQDSTTMTMALENGSIDAASFPPAAYQSIKNDVASGRVTNLTTFGGPRIDQYWTEIAFCMKNAGPNPSRLDPVVRQAISMATDKSYIVDNFYLGLADIGSTLIPPINAWHYEPNATEKAKSAYNLNAAAALLQSNGYIDIDSDGIRECTISSPAVQLGLVPENTKMTYQMLVRKEHPEEKDIALYLKSQWAQVGIVINYMVVEELTLSGTAYSYKYDTLIWYWSADVDPNHQLFVLSSYALNGWNDCGYSNPAYDSNYIMSVKSIDESQRRAFVDNCQSIVYNDHPYIILANLHQTYAWRSDTFAGWGNWSAHPGLSIDNSWSANPLYFNLMPLNAGPVPLILTARPNPVRTFQTVVFNISAMSASGSALTFTLYFGDGRFGVAHSHGGTTETQYVEIKHEYTRAGNYTLTVWIDDHSDNPDHNVSSELVDWMAVEKGPNIQLMAMVGGIVVGSAAVAITAGVYLGTKIKKKNLQEAQNMMKPPPTPPPPPS